MLKQQGRDQDSHREQPLPIVGRAKDQSSVTMLENISLELLERIFNNYLDLGGPEKQTAPNPPRL